MSAGERDHPRSRDLGQGKATFSTVEAGLAIEIKFTTAGHAEVFGSARSQTSCVPDVSYSRSRLKRTNRSLRPQCVNLKPSCLDSLSATPGSR